MRRFIDLFAGIGGFHVALKRAGLDCVFSSETDRAAATAYAANFGQSPAGDIREIPAESIPEHDVLCAGFPCQSFSRSGNGGGLADERGRLFYEIVRIARHHKPQVLLLENVKAILTIDNGNVMREIYGRLRETGYGVEHVALNSSDFGVPQKRERVYFVALRKQSSLRFIPPRESRERVYLKDALLPDERTENLVVRREDIVFDRPKEQEFALRPIRIGYVKRIMQGYRIYSPSGHAVTISANGGGVGYCTGLYYVNGKVRRLHLDEVKRVMGFDPKHAVSKGTAGYKQLGNAVIPGMVGRIYDGVRR